MEIFKRKQPQQPISDISRAKSKRLRPSLISFYDDIHTDTENSLVYRSPAAMEISKPRCYCNPNQPPSKPPSISFIEDISPAMQISNQPPSEDISARHKLLLLPPSVNLSEDIFTEILLRLPVKSILRFKAVSKLWRSIVSSRRFREIHVFRYHRHATTDHLFFKFDRSSFLRVLPNFSHDKPEIGCFVPSVVKRPDYHRNMTCASSCNGLLLLKSSNEHSLDNKYYVYNPTTDEYKVIDLPPRITQKKNVCASLAFDPNESSLNNKTMYKIIFLYPVKELSLKCLLEVYSSTTGTCEASTCDPLVGHFLYENFDYYLVGDCDYDGNRGLFCNGAIHWLHKDGTLLTYFNVHTECINKIPTPCSSRSTRVRYYGESQGHLHIVNSEWYFHKSSVLYVNELKRDYSGWFLKYKIELASIISAFPRSIRDEEEDGDDYYGNFISVNQNEKVYAYCGTFMSIIRDKEEDGDDSTMVLVACGEWVEYNFKKKTTRRICKFMHPELSTSLSPSAYWFKTHQFIPTLTCI